MKEEQNYFDSIFRKQNVTFLPCFGHVSYKMGDDALQLLASVV